MINFDVANTTMSTYLAVIPVKTEYELRDSTEWEVSKSRNDIACGVKIVAEH